MEADARLQTFKALSNLSSGHSSVSMALITTFTGASSLEPLDPGGVRRPLWRSRSWRPDGWPGPGAWNLRRGGGGVRGSRWVFLSRANRSPCLYLFCLWFEWKTKRRPTIICFTCFFSLAGVPPKKDIPRWLDEKER